MLSNHPPLIVAEQFGTLASLYSRRIGPASGGTLMIMPFIHDQDARHSCVEIGADICHQLRSHAPAVG
jgi:hypothetical protein